MTCPECPYYNQDGDWICKLGECPYEDWNDENEDR